MHPVIRVGETGKWERTKDSPIYDVRIHFLENDWNEMSFENNIFSFSICSWSMAILYWHFSISHKTMSPQNIFTHLRFHSRTQNVKINWQITTACIRSQCWNWSTSYVVWTSIEMQMWKRQQHTELTMVRICCHSISMVLENNIENIRRMFEWNERHVGQDGNGRRWKRNLLSSRIADQFGGKSTNWFTHNNFIFEHSARTWISIWWFISGCDNAPLPHVQNEENHFYIVSRSSRRNASLICAQWIFKNDSGQKE